MAPAIAVAPAMAQVDSATGVVINEIQPDGTDWIELANRNTNDSVDISGWTLIDDKDSHTPYTFPEGTTIESGGYISIEPDSGADGFGLGKGGDSVTLKNAEGTVMDTFTWDAQPEGTLARVPDMTGDFVADGTPSRDQRNSSASTPDKPDNSVAFPGKPITVKNQKPSDAFDVEDMSGVDFDKDGNAYVVNNDAGNLFKLSYNADSDSYTVAAQWSLKYPDGSGMLDTEGVTVNPDGTLTVSTERDNSVKDVSRPSLLHYTLPGTTNGPINADYEVNLSQITGDLEPNGGLEAVEYIPELKAYAVGVESTGEVLVVSLDNNHKATLLQRYTSPFPGVMALDYNNDTLRVVCDDVCDGHWLTMTVQDGKLVTDGTIYKRPEAMGSIANEGFASFTDSAGTTRYLWADDADTDNTSLRSAVVKGDSSTQPGGSLDNLGSALPVIGSLAVVGIGVAGAVAFFSGTMIDQLPLPANIKDALRSFIAQR